MALRLGIVGVATESDSLRKALHFLLADAEVDRVYCLSPAPWIRKELQAWAQSLLAPLQLPDRQVPTDAEWMALALRAASNVVQGGVGPVDAGGVGPDDASDGAPPLCIPAELRDAMRAVRRLRAVHTLDDDRGRGIEMLGTRCVTMVLEKSVLTEEDVANAALILYGRAPRPDLRRFGKRVFFTPGPLNLSQDELGHVGVVDANEDEVALSLFDLEGTPLWTEQLFAPAQLNPGVRMTVRGA